MNDATLTKIAQELDAARGRLEKRKPGDRTVGRVARLIGRIGTRLACPPRIAILGEFNSGKSTLANALLGRELLPTSIHANTRIPVHIKYAQFPVLSVELANHAHHALGFDDIGALDPRQARMLHLGLPVERLKTFELIDTPGLASGQPHLDRLTRHACSRSHLSIWCTTSAQAWKATERTAWLSLPQRLRASGVLAVTHKDGLCEERNVARLRQRIEAEAAPLFGSFAMLSATGAVDASQAGDTEGWILSGGADICARVDEAVINETANRLAGAERVLGRAATKLDPSATTAALVA